MSVKALEWASTVRGISRLEKTILKEIANRYNEQKGRAWPSQNRMSRDTGYSRSSINRALNGLEEKGLIARFASFDSTTGARSSNRYFLPKYEPHAVPVSHAPFQVEPYFEHDGSPTTDEWQETVESFVEMVATKSPSVVP